MSKNNIIWIVIGILAVAAIAFAVTRKTASNTTSSGQETTRQQNTSTSQNTPPSQPVSETKNDCVRNYDANKYANKKVEFANKIVTLEIKGFGTIKIAPNDKVAPKTSENFVKLADSGFYNCLTFHRISNLTGDPVNPGRIIQGGDPKGDGTGGPGYTIPAEINLKHTKGAIAMARTSDQVNPKRESSGSQFYISVDPVPFLDGQYTVFGEVVEGMDVVEKISKVEIFGGVDGPPRQPVIIEKATVSDK